MTANISLFKRLDTIDATIRAKAEELAEARARISYKVTLVPYDIERKEPPHDAIALRLLFVFPLMEKRTVRLCVSEDYETKHQFARRRGTAFGASMDIGIVCETTEVPCTEIKVTTGALQDYDAEMLVVQNPFTSEDNDDWILKLEFDYDNDRLCAVVLMHDPASCLEVIKQLKIDAIAVEELRLCNLLSATRHLQFDDDAPDTKEKKRKLDDE